MAQGNLKGTLTGGGGSIPDPAVANGSVAVNVGDLIRAVLCEQTASSAIGASDNLGNVYTLGGSAVAGTRSGIRAFSRVTVAGTLTQVRFDVSSSTRDHNVCADVFEGPFETSPLDKSPALITGDTTSPLTCPASGALAQPNELVTAWMAIQGSITYSATSPNIKSFSASASGNVQVVLGYQVVNATSSVSPEFTGTNPTAAVLGTDTFKFAALPYVPKTPTPQLGPLLAQ